MKIMSEEGEIYYRPNKAIVELFKHEQEKEGFSYIIIAGKPKYIRGLSFQYDFYNQDTTIFDVVKLIEGTEHVKSITFKRGAYNE